MSPFYLLAALILFLAWSHRRTARQIERAYRKDRIKRVLRRDAA